MTFVMGKWYCFNPPFPIESVNSRGAPRYVLRTRGSCTCTFSLFVAISDATVTVNSAAEAESETPIGDTMSLV